MMTRPNSLVILVVGTGVDPVTFRFQAPASVLVREPRWPIARRSRAEVTAWPGR
jgi:hypothetical protein